MSVAVIVDLDGVVYRGNQAVAGSPEALERLDSAGAHVVFATNNSTRTIAQVAEKLARVAGYEAGHDQIVTSARAAVGLIPDDAATCMVVGGDGIKEAVTGHGLSIEDGSTHVDCVVVGLDRDFDYGLLDRAARAVREGALFVATNRDPTFPTPDGLRPGAGAMVAAIEAASGVAPVVAGKPWPPIRALIRGLGVGAAWVVGDRLDTDIALAAAEPDWTSVLVLTGVTRPDQDTTQADRIAADLAAAVDMVLAGDDER